MPYLRGMILYNVTAIVDESIQLEWKSWMQETYIPEVMGTGFFVSQRMLRVLDSPNEGVTFCVQFIAESVQKFRDFEKQYGVHFAQLHPVEFQNKFVFFPTLMEFVDSI